MLLISRQNRQIKVTLEIIKFINIILNDKKTFLLRLMELLSDIYLI